MVDSLNPTIALAVAGSGLSGAPVTPLKIAA